LAVALATLLAAGCLLVAASSSYHVRRAQKDRDGRGGLLYVESYGPLSAREAIVFLPGMMGTTTYWREAGAPSLAVDRRVLLVDELGFGHSPWPEGAYTLEQHLTALEETLAKQPSGEHLILVGHSFGAMLAVEYAAVHADSVRHVILFGVPLYRGEQEARQRIGAMSALADLTARNSWLARLVCTLHAAFLPATTYLLPLLRGDLPPEVAADGALHFWPSLHGSVENIVLKHSIEPAVMLLGDKLTIVHGRRDRITPIERAREVVVASGAALIETDDDHGSYWRDATRVVRECLRIDSPPP
jgi:pimeloyl-ACP methyl ester carboxylesterase